MSKHGLTLALLVLAITMLTGCKQQAGMPTDVHTATTHTLYITTDSIMSPCGHMDWFQGEQEIWDDYTYTSTDSTIRRAFDYYETPTQPPLTDTSRAYPRKNGHCVFRIPGFMSMGGTPACTLFYYQTAHSGSADLAVVAWVPEYRWPPTYFEDRRWYFWDEWNSPDTVATDSTHTNNGTWYKVPLSNWARSAIADSGAEYYGTGDHAIFFTGWIYPSYMANHGVDGWYTDVSGSNGYAPYIKVVYDD